MTNLGRQDLGFGGVQAGGEQGRSGVSLVKVEEQALLSLDELTFGFGQLLRNLTARVAVLDLPTQLSQLVARTPQLGQERLGVRHSGRVRRAATRIVSWR
jgi:hypothetical protein